MSSALGWTCTKCTYKHRVPGNRCVMCHELRVTRELMRDFVLGKPIPEECKPGPLYVKKNPYLMDNNKKQQPLVSSQNNKNQSSSSSSSSSSVIVTATAASDAIVSNVVVVAAAAASAKSKQIRPAPAVLNNPYTKKQKTHQQNLQQKPPSIASVASISRPPLNTARSTGAATTTNNTASSILEANTSVAPTTTTLLQTTAENVAKHSSSGSNTNLNNNNSQRNALFLPVATMNRQTTTTTTPRSGGLHQQANNTQAISSVASAAQAPMASSTSSTTTTTTSLKPSSSGSIQASYWNPSRTTSSSSSSSSSNISSTTILSNHSTNQQQQQRQQQQQQQQPTKRPALQRQQQQQQQPQPIQQQQLQPIQQQQQHEVSAHNTNATAPPFVRAVHPVFQPGPVPFDPTTAHEWIYPVSDTYAKRQYQLEISQTAVLHNTLVSLPTGLGKTLIAAVVMYNYYRWFPTGKVIFLAPTQPLVKQQVGACHDIMGFLPADTAVLTGNTAADKRTQIWKSRRIFYCTPQTVQRDLDANRLDARQVVCLVLDEAHKATGDYAYVKIVEHLQTVGAKFRLLALSATPGTSLAAIQQVVFALQINRIEARTDDDPTVAPYIHRRDTEYIVVPQTSLAKKVEYALTDIVSPLLGKLRSSGALRSAGYATVTTYTLIRAMQEYKKRENDGDHGGGGGTNMMGYFMAAHQFVQMRTDLQKHGLGMVRTKLQRLRQERNRGPMASIVRGKKFATLWDRVQEASGCSDSSQQENANVRDKLSQNPKLAALVQVLMEHFERHRNGTSTRVIVFSQWRDSVSEIVSVLETYQPLIRPRCFVGQNAGANKANEKGKLKGMKQAEQQEVIRQFREGVYNVLVCTSIGEEGLDIGQVDLIGCFDVLRSPIRSLQRIGRTGRKRAGRVVVFVSEGPEEITLKSSKQSERNLAHALRNPKSFKVSPTVPMFPCTPTLLEQKMAIGNNFRMSQVEGIDVSGKRSDRSSLGDRSSSNRSWKLTEVQERHRLLVLGECGSVLPDECHDNRGLSMSLLRRFRQGRSISHCLQKNLPLGRSAQLLRHIEKAHRDKATSEKEESSGMNFLRIGRRGDPSMRTFPLMPLDANEKPVDLSCFEQFQLREQESDVYHVPSTESNRAPVQFAYQQETQNKENEPDSAHSLSPAYFPTSAVRDCSGPMETTSCNHECLRSREDTNHCPDAGFDRPQSLKFVNPYAAPKGRRDDNLDNSAGLKAENPIASSLGRLDGVEARQRSVVQDGIITAACMYTDHSSPNQQNHSPTDQGKIEETVLDEFVLQSQDDSDSDIEESQTVDPKPSHVGFPVPKISECDFFQDISTSSSSAQAVVPTRSERKVCETSGSNTSVENGEYHQSRKPDSSTSCPNFNDTSNNDQKCCNNANEEPADDFVLPSQGSNSDADDVASVVSVEDTLVSGGNVATEATGDDFVLPSQDSSSSDDSKSEDEIICKGSRKAYLKKRAEERSPFQHSGDDLCDTQSCQPSQRFQKQTPPHSSGDDLCDTQSCQRFRKQTPPLSSGDDLCDTQSCQPFQRFQKQTPPHRSGDDLFDTQSCQPSRRFQKQTPLHSSGDDLCDTQSCQPSQQTRVSRPALRVADSLLSGGNESSASLPPAKKRRRLAIQRFFDEEAGIDSGDDMDGDESESSEVRRIEEEEQDVDDFINDSSQLGFSPDALDEVDPEVVHKALDMERAKKQQFATPIFNRRMIGSKNRDSWIDKAPDSANGLGNMHFIRSVIEHHKKGGRAEDIEKFYHELEEEEGPIDEEALVPQRDAPVRTTVYYEESDSDEES